VASGPWAYCKASPVYFSREGPLCPSEKENDIATQGRKATEGLPYPYARAKAPSFYMII